MSIGVPTARVDLNNDKSVHFWLNPWSLKGTLNSGDTITTLTESSQNGHIGTGTGLSSTYPIYHEDSNGLPYIKFNSGQWIDFGDVLDDVIGTTGFTAYVLVELNETNSWFSNILWAKHRDSNNGCYQSIRIPNSGEAYNQSGSSNRSGTSVLSMRQTINIWNTKSVITFGFPQTHELYTNLKTSNTVDLVRSGSGLPEANDAQFRVGGGYNDTSNNLNGKIYDIIITNKPYDHAYVRLLKYKYNIIFS